MIPGDIRSGWRIAVSILMVLAGLGLFAFGNLWAPVALDILPDSPTGFWLELIIPFLPMLFVGCGALLFVSDRGG